MASSLVLNRNRKVPAEDTAAFGAIAERFRRGGALERAVSLCREGLQKFPDHVSARVTLGWALLDLGKYDEARIELEQVLRRAPDNLAAIRGLAELHDRFEHTLNLPMDGPGQWPPPPEATAHIADEEPAPHAAVSAAEPDLQFAPAELGIPIWSPPAAAVAAEPASSPVTPEITYASTPPVATSAPAAPVMAPEPQAATQAPPASVASAAAVSPAASGMSSVREIEMPGASDWAGVTAEADPPSVDIVADAQAATFAGTATIDPADDLELEALIAEAESLDAAAAPVMAPHATDIHTAPSASIEAADSALELSIATGESGEIDLPLVLDAVAPQLADDADTSDVGEIIVSAAAGSIESAADVPLNQAVEIDDVAEIAGVHASEEVAVLEWAEATEIAMDGEPAQAAEAAAAIAVAAVQVTAADEAPLEVSGLDVAAADQIPLEVGAVELVAAEQHPPEAVAVELVTTDELPLEAVAVDLPAVEAVPVEEPVVEPTGPVFELTPFVATDFAAEDDDEFGDDAAMVMVMMDEELAPVLPFHIAPTHPALPALERFLAQVESRRSQLMTQSVA